MAKIIAKENEEWKDSYGYGKKREKTKNIGNEKRKQENSPHHVPSSPFQGLLGGSSKPGRRQPEDKMLDIFIYVESITIVDSLYKVDSL